MSEDTQVAGDTSVKELSEARRATVKAELASELQDKVRDWHDEAEGVYGEELDDQVLSDLLDEVLKECEY